MRQKRAFTLLIALPLAAILLLGGFIFGRQAMSENEVDFDVQHALATALDTSSEIELQHLQSVNYGYGVCGLYKTSSAEKGFAPFYYDSVNSHLTLDINSQRYQSSCGLASICS